MGWCSRCRLCALAHENRNALNVTITLCVPYQVHHNIYTHTYIYIHTHTEQGKRNDVCLYTLGKIVRNIVSIHSAHCLTEASCLCISRYTHLSTDDIIKPIFTSVTILPYNMYFTLALSRQLVAHWRTKPSFFCPVTITLALLAVSLWYC